MTVLVTGAGGFVGRALAAGLVNRGRFGVKGLLHTAAGRGPAAVDTVVADLTVVDPRPLVEGVDAVVHLAARVHVMRDRTRDPLAEYRRVNVEATARLAEAAAAARVRRFVYLSSVKVNGDSGTFTEADAPAPADAYGISKLEAEAVVRAAASGSGMEVVIIRPPLVYGPGVSANFAALIHAIRLGIPLPLGAVDNRRSLVGLENLVDFIVTCLEHPRAAGELFFVSDGEDLSTTALLRRLAAALERPARLVPVPPGLLRAAAALTGRGDMMQRLLGSLCVDSRKARRCLGWEPPLSVDEGLRQLARAR